MSTKADWSLKQTSDYLEGKVRDATLDRILQGISLEKFKDYGVYIWNLHPFFRGGGEHSSNIGLPKDAAWLAMAWKWLSAFTKEVDAHTVVLACSGEVLPQHKDSNNCQNDLRKEGQFCWNWKRQEADTIEKEFFLSLQCSHIFRMHHPSSWNRQKKKDGQKRMAEIFRGLLDGWHAETMECRPSHAPW